MTITDSSDLDLSLTISRRDASVRPAGECLCKTITIKSGVVRASQITAERIKTSGERIASHKQALSRSPCQIKKMPRIKVVKIIRVSLSLEIDSEFEKK